MDWDWVTIGAILTVVTIVGGIWHRWVLPFIRRIGQFLDDWNGEPPRPGYDGRSGVLERLGRVEHEVHTNNGTSMRDAVNRIEESLKMTAEEAAGLREAVAASTAEQTAMWTAIEAIAKAQPPDQ